ncbi:hypothetical protein LTR37_018446 [Vermiconidia calcicola]|uniref:Uncharacterized protein n=1 Tax=Vermiconidia calcicola TaxID=1690605 RepID=A0ACC3MJX8_9PEZI|nr:hypothetical protein LTR37_018446 [Vermiconidia calcicola]
MSSAGLLGILDLLITIFLLALVCGAGRYNAVAEPPILETTSVQQPAVRPVSTTTPTVVVTEKQQNRPPTLSRETLALYREHIQQQEAKQARTWVAPRPCETAPKRPPFNPDPAPLLRLARALAVGRHNSSSSINRAGRDEIQQPVAAPAPSASLPLATAILSTAPASRQYDTTTSAAALGNVLVAPIRVDVLHHPVSISTWAFDPRLSIPAASTRGAAPAPPSSLLHGAPSSGDPELDDLVAGLQDAFDEDDA